MNNHTTTTIETRHHTKSLTFSLPQRYVIHMRFIAYGAMLLLLSHHTRRPTAFCRSAKRAP